MLYFAFVLLQNHSKCNSYFIFYKISRFNCCQNYKWIYQTFTLYFNHVPRKVNKRDIFEIGLIPHSSRIEILQIVPVAYAENFHVGGVWVRIIWWSFVFGWRCLWSHNLTSFPRFQTNVLAKFVDTIMHIFLHPLPLFHVSLHWI